LFFRKALNVDTLFAALQNIPSIPEKQCWGSGRFLIGSGLGSKFCKRPDPDLDQNKISAYFLLEAFISRNMFYKIPGIHEPKS
jgi:hypothetical protein